MNSKVTIGSEEWISLGDLNIPHIKARVDSGAKTSSLHALNIQPYHKEGQTWVSFDVYPIQNDGKRRVKCNALVIDKRIVKSSTGNREQRFVIQTFMTIGANTWSIEITLTKRINPNNGKGIRKRTPNAHSTTNTAFGKIRYGEGNKRKHTRC